MNFALFGGPPLPPAVTSHIREKRTTLKQGERGNFFFFREKNATAAAVTHRLIWAHPATTVAPKTAKEIHRRRYAARAVWHARLAPQPNAQAGVVPGGEINWIALNNTVGMIFFFFFLLPFRFVVSFFLFFIRRSPRPEGVRRWAKKNF